MFIFTHKLQTRLASLTFLLAGAVLLIAILVLGIAGSSTTSASHSAQGHYSLSGTLNLQGVSASATVAQIAPTIDITNTGTGSTTQVAVSANGGYIAQGLPAGTYQVDATASVFLTARFTTVAVTSSSLVLPDHQLRSGDVNGDGIVNIRDISATAASFGQLDSCFRRDGALRGMGLRALWLRGGLMLDSSLCWKDTRARAV